MCFDGLSMGFGVQVQQGSDGLLWLGSDGCGVLDVGSVSIGQQVVMHGLIRASYQERLHVEIVISQTIKNQSLS